MFDTREVMVFHDDLQDDDLENYGCKVRGSLEFKMWKNCLLLPENEVQIGCFETL
jgi:hypothetical protein